MNKIKDVPQRLSRAQWNIACDIVVNRILTEEGIGRMPEMGEGIAEKIYDLLAKQEENGGLYGLSKTRGEKL